ncbi:MAG: hypothetical protein RDU25_02940 [Patescibacteria group bacterium]|nr:hypothetical protein [Patescibacteria group bacterium]
MNEKPIVLFPYGQLPSRNRAEAAAREQCMSLIFSAGGDIMRVFDGPWGSDPSSLEAENAFLRCISRLNEVVNGSMPPYIVMTRVSPLPLIVLAKRRRLCEDSPSLKRALWILYVDPDREPFFFNNANSLGLFDLDPKAMGSRLSLITWCPKEEWRSSESEKYAVIMPYTVADKHFKEQVTVLRRELCALPARSQTNTRMRAVSADADPPPVSHRR